MRQCKHSNDAKVTHLKHGRVKIKCEDCGHTWYLTDIYVDKRHKIDDDNFDSEYNRTHNFKERKEKRVRVVVAGYNKQGR